jgi:hypothetical protein
MASTPSEDEMNEKIDALLEKMKLIEEEIEEEIENASNRLTYTVHRRKVLFTEEVRAYHRKMKKKLRQFVLDAKIGSIITAPVLLAMAPPIIILDMAVTIYQWICFPVYGIKIVPRSDFIVIDRHHLEYLNIVEKFNCAYCGYANGVANYFREIAARTEGWWCPIKHARKIKKPHSRYHTFVDYDDAAAYRKRCDELLKNGIQQNKQHEKQ